MRFTSEIKRSPEITDYVVERWLLSSGRLARELLNKYQSHIFFVVCDETTKNYFGTALQTQLNTFSEISGVAKLWAFPAGEQSKNPYQLIDLAFKAKEYGLTKKNACFIALGGGVVGDTALFLAATYGRGSVGISVPTTLLAQVDSGIGGKTGVDLGELKNYLGMIKQPAAVYIDSDTLSTLSYQQFATGMAEAIKTAAIFKKKLFDTISKERERVKRKDPAILDDIIQECVRCKVMVVEEDPDEQKNLRHILNLGHTIGHAIELKSGLLHGHAVSVGLVGAYYIARERGIVTSDDLGSVIELLSYFNLPVKIDKGWNLSKTDIIRLMKKDKKSTSTINMVLPHGIGLLYDKVVKTFDASKQRYSSTSVVEEYETEKALEFLAA